MPPRKPSEKKSETPKSPYQIETLVHGRWERSIPYTYPNLLLARGALQRLGADDHRIVGANGKVVE